MLRFDRNKIGTQPKNNVLCTITDNWTKLLLTGISPQNSELNAKASKRLQIFFVLHFVIEKMNKFLFHSYLHLI